MTTLHFLITEYKHLSIKQLLQNKYIQSIALIGVCIFPWLLLTASHMSKLSSSWYFPVDFHLLSSVLGNMFIGYEGTPWYLWGSTAFGSISAVGTHGSTTHLQTPEKNESLHSTNNHSSARNSPRIFTHRKTNVCK